MPSIIKQLSLGAVMAVGLAGPVVIPAAAAPAGATTNEVGASSPASSDAAQSTAGGPRHHRHRHRHGHAAAHDAGYGIRLTQFNILTSEIAPGGLKRARRAASFVKGQHATAAAFEEVSPTQLHQLQRSMTGYHFFPRRKFGSRGSAIQIGWHTKDVSLVRTGHVEGPFLGYQRAIPYVQLRERRTRRTFWVMAIHNAPGSHESERDAETRVEIARLKKLLKTHDPVFAIGDVNERSEFCDKVARATTLDSMGGGRPHHPCPVPRKGGPDWMLGSGAHASHFRKVYNHISDHPALTVRAHVPAARS